MKRLLIVLFFCGALAAFGQSTMRMAGSPPGGTVGAMPSSMLYYDPAVGAQLREAWSAANKVAFRSPAEAQALAAHAPVVLFFAADWNPLCQADMRDIDSDGARLGNIAIVVVDYYKEKSLAARLGVSSVDTFVQIDSNGDKVGAWSGGGVSGILQRVVRP